MGTAGIVEPETVNIQKQIFDLTIMLTMLMAMFIMIIIITKTGCNDYDNDYDAHLVPVNARRTIMIIH